MNPIMTMLKNMADSGEYTELVVGVCYPEEDYVVTSWRDIDSAAYGGETKADIEACEISVVRFRNMGSKKSRGFIVVLPFEEADMIMDYSGDLHDDIRRELYGVMGW